MLLRLFKGTQPALIIIIPLLTGLLWIKSFIAPSDITLTYDLHEMPFWHFINIQTAGVPVIRKILAFILLIINALWLTKISTRFILIKGRSYLPALFFGFICSALVYLQDLNPAIFAITLVVPAIEIIFNSYKEERLTYKYFEAAFLVSLGSMFYARTVFFMFVVWTALSILRTPNWREWVMTIIGFLLPYFFLIMILYLTDQDIPGYFSKIASNFRIVWGITFLNLYSIIFLLLILFLIGISSFQMISVYQGLKIYARMYYRILFWMFISFLIIILAFYNHSAEMIYFLAVPVSYILTFYFYSLRLNWLGEILFTTFLGTLILGIVMS